MSTTDQLEAERRAVTLAIYGEDKGQVDEYANECHSTRQRYERMADVAIEASALPLRNAQVEAVLAKLGSLEAMAQIEPDDDEYARGINMAASIIRRDIEEAGA